MPITTSFHDAVILSIVEYSRVPGVGFHTGPGQVYDLLRRLIYDLTHITSSSGVPSQGEVKEILKKHQKKQCAVFGWGDNEEKHERKHCARWLTKVEKKLRKTEDLDDLTWCDVITYLMFIQSNCHHHGNQKYPKICKTPESFLNFFYKSKNGFDPEKTPEQCRGYPWSGSEGGSGNRNPEGDPWDTRRAGRKRDPTKEAELLSYYWVETFERDKKGLLMFHDLSIHQMGPYLLNPLPGCARDSKGPCLTIGWTSSRRDFIPWGAVLNLFREYHKLPPLSGEYFLGAMSTRNDIQPYAYNNKEKEKKGHCEIMTFVLAFSFVTIPFIVRSFSKK